MRKIKLPALVMLAFAIALMTLTSCGSTENPDNGHITSDADANGEYLGNPGEAYYKIGRAHV